MFSSVYFAVLPLLGALVRGYADPGRCTGACNVRDPGLVQRDDGMYFLFSTHDKIGYASAKSLSGPWTLVGSVVPDGSIIDLSGRNDLWAPDVHKVGDSYHVYYSVSTLGSQTSAIGLATSDTMKLGSWKDHGSIGLQSDPSKPYNAIDANLFQEGGSILMNFGSYWHNIFQTTMNDEGTKITSEPHNIAYDPAGNHRVEGGYLYKHGLFYYLFYSHGKAGHYAENRPAEGEEYKIKVCRSLVPTGQFAGPEGTPCTEGGGMIVLESHGEVYGPGGQGVFTDPKYGPVLYYHYTNTSIGFSNSQQRFGWNPIDFSTGWPIV